MTQFQVGDRVRVNHPAHAKPLFGVVSGSPTMIGPDEVVRVTYDPESVPFIRVVGPPDPFPGQTPRPIPEWARHTHEYVNLLNIEPVTPGIERCPACGGLGRRYYADLPPVCFTEHDPDGSVPAPPRLREMECSHCRGLGVVPSADTPHVVGPASAAEPQSPDGSDGWGPSPLRATYPLWKALDDFKRGGGP
jgi:hypothetical protein